MGVGVCVRVRECSTLTLECLEKFQPHLVRILLTTPNKTPWGLDTTCTSRGGLAKGDL